MQEKNKIQATKQQKNKVSDRQSEKVEKTQSKEETGGPQGLEPTRYGDWERKGRCIDF